MLLLSSQSRLQLSLAMLELCWQPWGRWREALALPRFSLSLTGNSCTVITSWALMTAQHCWNFLFKLFTFSCRTHWMSNKRCSRYSVPHNWRSEAVLSRAITAEVHGLSVTLRSTRSCSCKSCVAQCLSSGNDVIFYIHIRRQCESGDARSQQGACLGQTTRFVRVPALLYEAVTKVKL